MEPTLPRTDGGFATRAVQAVTARPEPEQRPVSPAIFTASAWLTERSAELGELLEDEREGYVYGRYDNPTNTGLHAGIATLHGAEAAWSCASGTAAIHATVEALRGHGRILATSRLYGGTYAMFARQSASAGWGVDHVDVGDLDAVAEALTDEHTILYAETIANPTTAVADLSGLAELTRDRDTMFVVDNTFASPYLCRPIEFGADLVVESATKFLGGHGDVVAGVVAGSSRLVRRVREATYELGGSLGPFEAYLVARGLQTLHLRVRESSRNAFAVAEVLEASDVVERVGYPGLASHPGNALAERQFGGRGFGGMLSLDLSTRERAEAFADAGQVFGRAASLGGVRSLVLHPASTSHRQLDDARLEAAGIRPGTVRLSVGVEDVADLTADVKRALSVASTQRD